MKLTFILFSFLTVLSYSQTAGILSANIGRSKSDIKEKLSNIELVRDWGKGSAMDMEEPGPNMLKFRFNEDDQCIGVNFMSFKKHPERYEAERLALEKLGWKVKETWTSGQFTETRYSKDGKILCTRNSPQVYEIGLENSRKWAKNPGTTADQKEVKKTHKRLSPENSKIAISKFGGIIANVTERKEDSFIATITDGNVSFNIGDEGEANSVSISERSSFKMKLGRLKVKAIDGKTITFEVLDKMEVKINGVEKDMFENGVEFHFAK